MKCGHCKAEGHSKKTCPALQETKYPKPPVKWVGGKSSIVDEVLSQFPKYMNNYIEPFLGGGSVLLAILTLWQQDTIQINGDIYAFDNNPNLIGLYRNIQSHCNELIIDLQEIVANYRAIQGDTVNRAATTLEEARGSRESYYYWIRSTFNAMTAEEKISIRGSALLLFLNKTCFRGLYREGPHGLNVPFEKQNQNLTIFDEFHLRQLSNLIQGVHFQCKIFQDTLAFAKNGDFIYLDPPYAPEKANSFVGYNADGFSGEQHALLFDNVHKLVERGVKVVMSNADVPLVRQAFPAPYVTQVISVRRAIHSKKPNSRTNEVLITHP